MKASKGGSVEFRVEKAGIIHAGVGKASFSADKLVENVKAFADAVQKAKPPGAKGHFINRIALSSTMGPGVKIEPATVLGGRQHRPLTERHPSPTPASGRGARSCGAGAARKLLQFRYNVINRLQRACRPTIVGALLCAFSQNR